MTKQLSYALLASFSFCLSSFAVAQTPIAAPGSPAFEVASIRPSPPPQPNPFGFPVRSSIRFESGGRVSATQATLRDLILNAYDLQDFRITGGPEWMNSARFDIVAKPAADFSGNTAEARAMLRSLLADRFKLRVHTESREAPVYHLVLANREGRFGPRLRPSSVDCVTVRAKRLTTVGQQQVAEPDCRPAFDANLRDGTLTIKFQGESMTALALLLSSPETRRVVLDKTGLAGAFDGDLTFVPEPLPGLPPLPPSQNGVSLFTALPEQLGLRLEPERGKVDFVVVDSSERPTAN